MLRGQRKKRPGMAWPPLTTTPMGRQGKRPSGEALPGSRTALCGLRLKFSLREPWMWESEGAFKGHLV